MDFENIIQKCYGITHWAAIRGRATLEKDEKTFIRAEANLNALVKKLIKIIKDETT